MKFLAESSSEGKLSLKTDENRERFSKFLREHKGMRLEISPMQPESRKQRGFYHGAVITLWVYLNGDDYKNSERLVQYHEIAKREFNGEMIKIKGVMHKVGMSTKGKLQAHIDRVIDMLEEQYGINRMEVLDPEKYKYFRDVIYSDGKYDTYIDYMKDIGILR